MTNNAQRAEILVQALPYIQQYNGQIVVIKYGGNANIFKAEFRNSLAKVLL